MAFTTAGWLCPVEVTPMPALMSDGQVAEQWRLLGRSSAVLLKLTTSHIKEFSSVRGVHICSLPMVGNCVLQQIRCVSQVGGIRIARGLLSVAAP